MNSKLPFSSEQCKQLFAAVLVHDDLYPNAQLPEFIHLDYSQEQLQACYQICLQVWQLGVQRKTLKKLILKIYKQQDLSPSEQKNYKEIRAKFKHLRFAYVTCCETHQYPKWFNNLTRKMGKFQDAFKNKKFDDMQWCVKRLRRQLNVIVFYMIKREVKQFKPSTPKKFAQYIQNEIKFITLHLKKGKITGKEFHELRKVISRQVALYDNLKTLYPSQYHDNISQYLSTINGLMGSFHDALIINKFNNPDSYYNDTFIIPEEIEHRLTCYIQRYK